MSCLGNYNKVLRDMSFEFAHRSTNCCYKNGQTYSVRFRHHKARSFQIVVNYISEGFVDAKIISFLFYIPMHNKVRNGAGASLKVGIEEFIEELNRFDPESCSIMLCNLDLFVGY